MNVKLISMTAPAIGDGGMQAEDIITYCARVSNPKNQSNTETAPKLIKFLIKHKHWSPFELANMCVEIKTSRAIATQILRHRSFSFQEFSQRYSSVVDLEPTELREQAKKNRQSSAKEIDPFVKLEKTDQKLYEFMCGIGSTKYQVNPDGSEKTHSPDLKASIVLEEYFTLAKQLYNTLINAGVARESARMVLPLTAETTMYMNGTVRSWIHYISLRTEENTQKEHRDIANAIKDIFVKQFPNVSEALDWSKEDAAA